MITKAKKLFQLYFQHQCFSSASTLSNLSMGPSILNASPQFGIREVANGGFAYTANENNPSQILYIPIFSRDPNFYNYTDLNFSPGKIWFVDGGTGSESPISVSDGTQLSVKEQRFNYPLTDEQFAGLKAAQIEGPLGNTWDIPLPKPGTPKNLLIDLTREPFGRYQLQLEFEGETANIEESFFVLPTSLSNQLPLAIFCWKPPTNATASTVPTYTLYFKARATFWRYVFPNMDTAKWQDFRIEAGPIQGQSITFEKQSDAITLVNGANAFIAESSAPISLEERPDWKIKFYSKQVQEGMQLPYPQINTPITLKEGEASVFQSDIYVYV